MYRFILILASVPALTWAWPMPASEEVSEEALGTYSKDIIDLTAYGSSLYGKPDRELTGTLVDSFNPETDEVNPEELGSYLEGDMLVAQPAILMRNGLPRQSLRWPKAVVPYRILGDFDDFEMLIIKASMAEYHRRTCIRFVPHTNETDFVSILSERTGCWSSVGRIGGEQNLNLQTPGCFRRLGTVLHELMHTVGFLHEQSRKERDSHVIIRYNNIRPRAMRNFRLVENTEAFGVPYDYDSVMHYSAKAFSRNGKPTIDTKLPGNSHRLGQREGLSMSDIEKLNRMYECDSQSMGTEGAHPANGTENSTSTTTNATKPYGTGNSTSSISTISAEPQLDMKNLLHLIFNSLEQLELAKDRR